MEKKKKLRDLRGAIEFLKEQEELFTIEAEVDPMYEIAGIIKELDGGPTLLFEKIKG